MKRLALLAAANAVVLWHWLAWLGWHGAESRQQSTAFILAFLWTIIAILVGVIS